MSSCGENSQHTDVKHWGNQLNVTKMTRTLLHVLTARGAVHATVNRAELGVVQAAFARPLLLLILRSRVSHTQITKYTHAYHGLRVDDVSNAHVLNLIWRHESKLDFLDALERRARRRKVKVRHDAGGCRIRDEVVKSLRRRSWPVCPDSGMTPTSLRLQRARGLSSPSLLERGNRSRVVCGRWRQAGADGIEALSALAARRRR